MADEASAELKKKRTFRKFTYRGVDLDQLLDMNNEGLMELFTCRIRRKFSHGLTLQTTGEFTPDSAGEELHQALIVHVQELIKVNTTVGELTESSLLLQLSRSFI